MYKRSARYYDALYSSKDYAAEVRRVEEAFGRCGVGPGAAVLDVACGTGGHIQHLHPTYRVEGLDLAPEMLAVARQRFPDLPLHQADMTEFDLGRQFDALLCLFSSIGYVRTLPRLRRTLRTFARHLRPGGVALVEPWFAPHEWRPGTVHASWVDEPELKIARINLSEQRGRLSVFVLHHLVGTPQGVEQFAERHEMGLFTHPEYQEAFKEACLTVEHDAQGLTGRGLYMGQKPLSAAQGV
ncbi:MAG: class I SAM-dependent methyltransferase [Chloroflexi bacterium]|nr:class I SAM-dependent methyltransferase [Chloroflexota bacterium]